MKRNKKGNNKKCFNLIEMVIIMVITCLFGIFIGSIITFMTIKTNPKKIDLTKDKYIERFEDSYENIVSTYYDSIDKSKLIDSAIKGMIDSLEDPYANYMNEDESITFKEEVEGKYVGIGCEITINEDNQAVISKIIASSPAEKQGLKVGDIIISIDNKDISNISDLTDLSLIRGNENTKVTLKIKREDSEKSFTLTRKKIDIESVTSELKEFNNNKIGIIKINVFASNTYKQFRKSLEKLEKKNIKSLIIDVRDNNGGYLSSVSDIASIFLQKNKIIYQLSSKGINEPILDSTKEKRNYKVAVLINENSASAAEVLAAALKDSYKAVLVGMTSYGKGTVQKAYYLSNGSSYKYTIQKWLTPKGDSIDKKGIKPDIIEKDSTKQLDAAIEALIN